MLRRIDVINFSTSFVLGAMVGIIFVSVLFRKEVKPTFNEEFKVIQVKEQKVIV